MYGGIAEMAMPTKIVAQNFNSRIMSWNYLCQVSCPNKYSTRITSTKMFNKENKNTAVRAQFHDRTAEYAIQCSPAIIITRVMKANPYKSSFFPLET